MKTFGDTKKGACIRNVIEDSGGLPGPSLVDRLEIYNILPSFDADDYLPRDAEISIKEPLYTSTADGVGTTVRVDHPSNVVVHRSFERPIPTAFWARQKAVKDTMVTGAMAGVAGQWAMAVELYTKALQLAASGHTAPGPDLIRDLHLERSKARRRLHHYDLAMSDALSCMIPADELTKANAGHHADALYEAAQAAVGLSDYDAAKQYCIEAKTVLCKFDLLINNIPRARFGGLLASIEGRLSERDFCSFNLESMAGGAKAGVAAFKPPLASFLHRTKVVEAGAGNQGQILKTSQAIKAGEIIFIERAFHMVIGESDQTVVDDFRDRDLLGKEVKLTSELVDMLTWNPTLADQFFTLWDGKRSGQGQKVAIDQDSSQPRVIFDTSRVRDICDLNAFGAKSDLAPEKEEHRSGIWLRASKANHCCLPNASRAFLGDMMIVRAIKDLAADEEITLTYWPPDTDHLTRRVGYGRDKFGFWCTCLLCKADEKLDQDTRVRRQKLFERGMGYRPRLGNPHPGNTNIHDKDRDEATETLEELRKTYPEEIYRDLPRVNCAALAFALAEDHMNSHHCTTTKSSRELFIDVLRDTGYVLTIVEPSATVELVGKSPLVRYETWKSLECLAITYSILGCDLIAKKLAEKSKELYITDVGVETGFNLQI